MPICRESVLALKFELERLNLRLMESYAPTDGRSLYAFRINRDVMTAGPTVGRSGWLGWLAGWPLYNAFRINTVRAQFSTLRNDRYPVMEWLTKSGVFNNVRVYVHNRPSISSFSLCFQAGAILSRTGRKGTGNGRAKQKKRRNVKNYNF